MPLPKPSFDRRTHAQLTAEGRALLPRLAPAWTDHNLSDPGITLLELTAWLVEMDLFRLDRVPTEMLRAFLRLAGVSPRPAGVAETVLTIASAAAVNLPEGLQLADAGGGLLFQTQRALTVSPAQLACVIDGAGTDVTTANAAGTPYLPFGAKPGPGTALYLGFDAPMGAAGTEFSAYGWTPDPQDDAQVREALVQEWSEAQQSLEAWCAPGAGNPPWQQHYEVRVAWEYLGPSGWKALPGALDETRALTLCGPLRFSVPADHASGGPRAGLFFIRCRIVKGAFECPPRIARIAHNTVPAAHAADAPMQALGRSRGHAGERFAVASAPVVAGSTRLLVTVNAVPDAPWREVPDWDLSGPHARDYIVEQASSIRLGDGRRGRVPPAGAELALRYRVGGGVAGNVAAGTLSAWPDNAHNQALVAGWPALAPTLALEQFAPACGGAEAESVADAVARAIAAQQDVTRAITLADFESLARAIPGVPVARARAIPDYYPALPCYRAAGMVSIVVVPDCRGPAPLPSAGMLAAVQRHLDRRRPPATEVHAIAPEYTPVCVNACLQLQAGARAAPVTRAALAALDRFFDPLHGGPDGTGWPPGRDVYRAEVLALLAAVPGVAHVTGLGLTGPGDTAPRCGNLPLCPHALPAAGPHRLSTAGAPSLTLVDRSIPHDCP